MNSRRPGNVAGGADAPATAAADLCNENESESEPTATVPRRSDRLATEKKRVTFTTDTRKQSHAHRSRQLSYLERPEVHLDRVKRVVRLPTDLSTSLSDRPTVLPTRLCHHGRDEQQATDGTGQCQCSAGPHTNQCAYSDNSLHGHAPGRGRGDRNLGLCLFETPRLVLRSKNGDNEHVQKEVLGGNSASHGDEENQGRYHAGDDTA